MQGRKLISLALLLLYAFSFAGAQSARKLKAEVIGLKLENHRLSTRIDSLELLLDSLQNVQVEEPAQAAYVPDESFVVSDSLLHSWVFSKQVCMEEFPDIESETFTSSVTDEEFVRRFAAMNSFIPLSFNDIVKKYCILYTERMPQQMSIMMGKSKYYWPLFDEIFTNVGVPLELKAMAIVESKLVPTATSRVGAKGLWQFMYGTARGYGLKVDSWMDERMDPIKSTYAAARYMRDAYNVFGDWYLAIASYNCGAGNVNKAIKRSGGSRDFWEIYDYLPRETRNYVPAFIGALYALHYHKEYSIAPKEDELAVPVDTFVLRRNVHYEQIAHATGLTADTIAAFNPQYLHRIVPGQERECVLRLPMESSPAFVAASDSLHLYRQEEYLNPVTIKKIKDAPENGGRILYTVKSGDVLGRIASRHHVSVAQIKKWNNMKSDIIRVGQKLVIYRR